MNRSFCMIHNWDHVFGLHTLNLPTFAHPETRRILLELARQDWSDEAIDRRVADGAEIAFCRDNIKAELPDRGGLVIQPPEIAIHGPVEIDLALLKQIGRTIDQIGHDPVKISAVLQDEFEMALNEEHLETIQSFLAGLQKNVRQEKRSWSIELI